MLLLCQLLHQFRSYLIAQSIAHDDDLLHRAVTLRAVEVLLPFQGHTFEGFTFLFYTGQPLQIHYIGHLGVFQIQLLLCLVDD